MDIFSVFTLCGGLAFFLYGMTVMSKSLEKMAGGKLERMLKRMTSSPFKSLLLGAGITIAIQSSSAMTVMLVGLVNSGVMELRQTIGIIMGSNIGTTLTAWILSLTGIESENVFVNLLKPENFSPLIALAGILLIMGSKRQRRRDVGRIMMGFPADRRCRTPEARRTARGSPFRRRGCSPARRAPPASVPGRPATSHIPACSPSENLLPFYYAWGCSGSSTGSASRISLASSSREAGTYRLAP